jgi:hypothetical protein
MQKILKTVAFAIIGYFYKLLFKDSDAQFMDESKLIFIVSQPRAGSTLLQKLLSNNPLVDTVSEPWLLLPLLSVYKPELIEARYNYKLAMEGFSDYLEKKGIAGKFRNELREMILGLYKVQNGNQYFIDKTPRNYEILELIFGFFPNARFIVLKRNPFAALHSMLSIWSEGKIRYKSIRVFYRDFLAAPFLIQDFCDKHQGKPNVQVVSYEKILSDPKSGVKEIYDWLEIPFDENVLEIGNNKKAAGLFGDDAQKTETLKEINSGLKDSWKSQMNKKEFEVFFSLYSGFLGAEFLEKYGYGNEFIQPTGTQAGGTNANEKPEEKFPHRNLFKQGIHSFFRLFGMEVRKASPAVKPKKDPDPEQNARATMAACLTDLKNDSLR